MVRWKRWALVLAATSAAVLPLVSFALADALDPNVPHTVVVGRPKGAAPAERVDAARSGRSKTKLPSQPKESWKRTLPSGTAYAPLVDGQGNLTFALTTSLVVRWSSAAPNPSFRPVRTARPSMITTTPSTSSATS